MMWSNWCIKVLDPHFPLISHLKKILSSAGTVAVFVGYPLVMNGMNAGRPAARAFAKAAATSEDSPSPDMIIVSGMTV